jgi:hypothetical protein
VHESAESSTGLTIMVARHLYYLELWALTRRESLLLSIAKTSIVCGLAATSARSQLAATFDIGRTDDVLARSFDILGTLFEVIP